MDQIKEQVREYYGKQLSGSNDLKTNACCTTDSIPEYIRQIFKELDPEILDKFYGCGSPLPPLLAGKTVLDLGCGTGRDVYIASKLVGENGRVIGVDMTDEQLSVAKKHVYSQMEKFGYSQPNVEFHKGFIEDLADLGIADNSVDVVISNCVINLSPNKKQVFSEIFRVLKPGGELYFSDVFSDRRIPQEFIDDPELYGECLSGALYIEDFRRMLLSLGIPDYRVTGKSEITIENKSVEEKIGHIKFDSMTIRAFKLNTLEDICEDYGQVAYYNGTIPDHLQTFDLDDHHKFEKGKPMLVCGNTAAMLAETRFGTHFKIVGDRSTHFGPFPCDFPDANGDKGGGACGC